MASDSEQTLDTLDAAALVPPERTSDPSFTASSIIPGSKVFVLKDERYRLAEILAFQVKKSKSCYYVHYVEFNKRLDEWIDEESIDFYRPLTLPKQINPKKDNKKQKKKSSSSNQHTKSATPDTDQKLKVKNNDKTLDEDEMDLDNLNVQGLVKEGEELTREEEIKKLRTSGSMTQNNVNALAKIRNFTKVTIGNHEVEPWYFSPYPIEYTDEGSLYICDFTLNYYASKKQFERFRSKCTLKHPPGNEIYRDEKVSFFEIDGRNQRTWCRNLCLLSKLFLDHKTLYYDVDPFLFYCMTRRDELGHHLVGYFSKEKESADAYNVACILTLPQYQRHGYGKLLIQFSYMLSTKEGKVGSPEKPLSDLGLLSYRAFWADTLAALLIEEKPTEISVDEISQQTAMTTTDILHTLQTMNMLRYYKGQHIICITDQVMQAHEKLKKKKKHVLDPKKLIWKPPVFTASQLRFGW
ncbi:Histone acetyltransferase [Pichia californica]|uniref:Histone acetyltransferase ESA1 n=1 Tax=Pichia californica TaxID=460514 RepID=A0A9P7BG25_9ASCO|nr:Histone acetyltransferase [[Candida] californica]KAG0689521.1 Histone acetyltransferase [[Candida] californica]